MTEDGADGRDAETRPLDPSAIAELSGSWIEALDDAVLPAIHRRQGPFPAVQTRPAFPADWRTGRRPRIHLHGAGLALFSLRTSGVAGRERVRDALWSTLGEVIGTASLRLVLLEGASGSGKTTLASWLGVRAEELGQARWLSIDAGAPGLDGDGIRAFLARLLRIDGLDRASAIASVHARLEALGVADFEDAVGLVQLAMSSEQADTGDGMRVHFGTERERWMLLSRLLSAMARQRPLVVGLDALHRDRASLSLAEHLRAELADAPVLLIGAVALMLSRSVMPLTNDIWMATILGFVPLAFGIAITGPVLSVGIKYFTTKEGAAPSKDAAAESAE